VNEALINQLPRADGVIAPSGKVVYRLHDSKGYLFLFGTKRTKPYCFDCKRCRRRVRWLERGGSSAVLSCHCLVAVCGPSEDAAPITGDIWSEWLLDAWLSERKSQRIQAN
jgi:hypothetical protein